MILRELVLEGLGSLEIDATHGSVGVYMQQACMVALPPTLQDTWSSAP